MKVSKSIAFLATIALIGCAPQDQSSKNKEALLQKREDLKKELKKINTDLDSLKSKNEKAKYPMVTQAETKLDTFIHKIEVQGDVEADKNISLNAESNGTIRKLKVSEGDEVREGQTIAIIDADLINDNIREVKASLELADFVYEKQKKLYDEGVSSKLKFKEAKNNKVSLEKKLASLRTQKRKTVLKAPFSGNVDAVFVKQGEMASPQMPIIRLVNNEEVKVTASISESYLTSVNIGTAVDLKFPVLDDTIIQEKVSSKGNYINPTNRTFKVRAKIKNNKVLLPNMIAVVRITDIEKPNAKIVPVKSLLIDNEDKNFVYVLRKHKKEEDELLYKTKKIYVNQKATYNGQVWVQSEQLQKGDRVVMEGARGVSEGDIVRLKKD